MKDLKKLYKSVVTGKVMQRIYWEVDFVEQFGWMAGVEMVAKAIELGSLVEVQA